MQHGMSKAARLLFQQTRKARENAGPLLNEAGTLVTQDMEKAELLNTSFISVFTSKTSATVSSRVATTRATDALC